MEDPKWSTLSPTRRKPGVIFCSSCLICKHLKEGVRGLIGVQEPVMALLTLAATTGSESLLGLQLGDPLHPELLNS